MFPLRRCWIFRSVITLVKVIARTQTATWPDQTATLPPQVTKAKKYAAFNWNDSFSEQWPKKFRSSTTTKPISLLQQQEDADFLNPERSSFPSKNSLLRHSKFQALSWMALRVSQQTFGFAVDGFDMTFSQKKQRWVLIHGTWMIISVFLLILCNPWVSRLLLTKWKQAKHLRFFFVTFF